MTASALALRSEWLLTDLNCPQVSTPVLSFVWTLYGDLSRLLRVIFITCISFPICTRNAEERFAGTFCCFHARLFGLKNARVFSKCFPYNISFWILKLFVFPAVAHFFGKEFVEEKPSEVLTVYILGLKEPDWQRAINNSLPNVNTIFNSCSIGIASNMLSLNRIFVVS